MGKADQSVQSTVNVGVAVAPTLTEADRMKLIEQREQGEQQCGSGTGRTSDGDDLAAECSSEHTFIADDKIVRGQIVEVDPVTNNIKLP